MIHNNCSTGKEVKVRTIWGICPKKKRGLVYFCKGERGLSQKRKEDDTGWFFLKNVKRDFGLFTEKIAKHAGDVL